MMHMMGMIQGEKNMAVKYNKFFRFAESINNIYAAACRIRYFRKTYCTASTCNKCRSYLLRHGHGKEEHQTTHHHWFLCSAVARHHDCCRFNFGPHLFTY